MMLNPEDRRAIEGLFDRLSQAEQQAPQRDRDAEELIRAELSRLPNAPYYMAQTIVVQQTALEAAETKIRELEAQGQQRQRSPWGRGDDAQDQRQQRGLGGGFGGGGFLGGAMQTALGVAGGVLLGSAIGSLFGTDAANAAEGGANDQNNDTQASDQQNQGQDSGQDAGADGGGDFGGDFDMGGDF